MLYPAELQALLVPRNVTLAQRFAVCPPGFGRWIRWMGGLSIQVLPSGVRTDEPLRALFPKPSRWWRAFGSSRRRSVGRWRPGTAQGLHRSARPGESSDGAG